MAGEGGASRPLRARELKLRLFPQVVAYYVSRPLRARELKPSSGTTGGRRSDVAPLAGA